MRDCEGLFVWALLNRGLFASNSNFAALARIGLGSLLAALVAFEEVVKLELGFDLSLWLRTWLLRGFRVLLLA